MSVMAGAGNSHGGGGGGAQAHLSAAADGCSMPQSWTVVMSCSTQHVVTHTAAPRHPRPAWGGSLPGCCE